MYDTVTVYFNPPCDFSVLMPGCCVALHYALGLLQGALLSTRFGLQACVGSYNTDTHLFKQAGTDAQPTLQPASSPTDSAGHEFLYAFPHSLCLCLDGLHDLICSMELQLELEAVLVYSFSGINGICLMDVCLSLITRDWQRSAQT